MAWFTPDWSSSHHTVRCARKSGYVINFITVACRISSWLKWYINYKNRLRLVEVIVKNKMSRFLWLVQCVQCESKGSRPPKTFCTIFTHAIRIFVKFCQFVASLYPHTQTYNRFISIFNKSEISFPGSLIVFTVWSFDLHQVKLPWLHRQWWVAPNSSDLNPLQYQV